MFGGVIGDVNITLGGLLGIIGDVGDVLNI